MTQLDLFTQVTRSEARRRILPSAAAYRYQVLNCIRWNGPVTDEQIADLTGLNPNTARLRRVELHKAGKIAVAGASHTRSGRRAATWVVTTRPDVAEA